jgi:hypothetical protein
MAGEVTVVEVMVGEVTVGEVMIAEVTVGVKVTLGVALEATAGVEGSCTLNYFLLQVLLHDHDKKQHESAICTCIHRDCVLGSAEPLAINLHLDPEPQGR